MALTVPQPNVREPLVDPRSGLISRPWLRFFQALQQAAGSGDAPADADYVVTAANATLTNERVLTSSVTAVVNTGTPGQVSLDVQPETVPVAVDVAGALDGDGTTADPLAVRVDGVTVTINGSNQLEAAVAALTETFLTATNESGTLANSRHLLAGTNVTFDDTVANQRTVNVASAGGDVTGPASATDEALARFDGTTGKIIQNSLIALSDTGALTFPDDVRQTFNPGANAAGLNVGTVASDPGTPTDGDVWYESTTPALKARIGGSTVELGAAGSTPVRTLGITIGDGANVITTGVKGYIQVPYAGTITAATVLSTDASATAGSIVVDVWKDSYANYPPTDADSITASAPPTLSGANKSQDTTLTGWTTSVSANDVLGFNVDSASTVTRVVVQLTVSPT